MSSPSSIDIAIVNYFGADDIQRCLASLGPWPHGTVWLVDNSHDAEQAQRLREMTRDRPWVRLLVPEKNLGFGRGCNLAFDQSSAPFFLLLNPDARVHAEDLVTLAKALADSPRTAAVSPRIFWNEQRSFLLPTAFPQTPGAGFLQTLASHSRPIAFRAARHYLRRQERLMASGTPFEVEFLAGAVMMVRREAVLEVGGLFDPAYFMFYEDSDLSLRLRRGGFLLALVPQANAVHEYRHKAFKVAMMLQSRQHFFRKCYPRFHALSGGLRWLDRLARPVPLAQWYSVLARPCRTLADFSAQTGGSAVSAFSPSMLMMPAIFRPPGHPMQSFDASEWNLLEPASYVARLVSPGNQTAARWVQFVRAPSQDAP